MTLGFLVALLTQQPDVSVVRSVRLDVPETERPRLERYVEIQPGLPFSPSVARHVVELFHATGEFEDVVIETTPGPEGLDVVVRPLRAPLLAMVRIEGPRVIDERRLRRAAKLVEREALWPDRLERAAKDVALALARDGYLEARVTARAERHEQGADAVFHLQPGARVRVGAVRVAGVPQGLARAPAPPAVRQGQIFDRHRAAAATERLRKQLAGLSYWRAAVDLEQAYDPTSARVDLTLAVAPGLPTTLTFEGVGLPARLRRRLEKLIREGRARPDALDAADEQIEAFFREHGHRDVRVSHREEVAAGHLAIVYAIDPGPEANVASVTMADGEEHLARGLLTRPGAPLREDHLARDSRELVRDLEERGYSEAKVDVDVPEGGGALPVVFRVRTGPKAEVVAVAVDSPVNLPSTLPVRELGTRSGTPYRVRQLAADRDSLLAAYRDAGYPEVEVVPELTWNEERPAVSIRFRVKPGERIDIDHVVLSGLHRTREAVVLRELTLKEGEPLGLARVLETQRRLGSLGLFRKVAVTEMDPEAEAKRTVVVAAEEAPATAFGWGFGYAERDLFRWSAEVTRRNLFGMDRSLSTFARISFRSSRLLATYREPYLLGRKQELLVTAFREEADRPYFDFVRYGATLQTSRSLGSRWSVISRYTFQLTDTSNIDDPNQVARDFASSAFSGPSASAVYDSRDDPLDPHRGHFFSADVQLSLAELGGDSFIKGFAQGSGYQRLTSKLMLALAGRVGLGRTFGRFEPIFLPEPDRFYAGGDYSLRGFALDSVRPGGGNGVVFGGAELRLDLGRYVSTAAFAEAGNVYPLASDLDLGDLRYTAGVGLRYKSALGPLRLDIGVKLDRRPGESPKKLHFAIGHAF